MHPDYYKQSLGFVQKPEELVVTEVQEDLITLRLAHELIHQRNAEIGGNRYDPFTLDSVVTDEEVARLPVERLLSVANERFRRSVLDSEIIVSSVTNYVDEGLASAGEYFLMDKVIEEHEKNGRKKMADVIKQAKQQFKDFVKRPSNVKYRDGLHIVSTLNNARGIERMPFILTEIDIDACDKIEEGTVAYNRIVEDPTRIPMKENT